jgi:hypothetical protein
VSNMSDTTTPGKISIASRKAPRSRVFFNVFVLAATIQGARATVGINSERARAAAALCLTVGLTAILSACGGGASAGTVTAVSISPATVSVPVNNQTQFLATVTIAGQTSTTTQPASTSTIVTWQVNGVSGGSAATGTIVADVNDAEEGIYTAPATVPSTNNGQVTISAVAQRNPNGTASGGANTSVTSNLATLTITPGLGIQIVSPPATVPAGGSALFSATLNGVSDLHATWTVTSSNGGAIGSINANSGVYTAPNFPPPGDVVTITATDSSAGTAVTASTKVAITYSDLALHGSYAFSFTGNDSQGFLAGAGSFFADGQGHILSGIEDVSSFLSGVSQQLQIKSTSFYNVGIDGRGTATLNTTEGVQTLAFVLTTNQHAIVTRFDSSATGSGSMDEQSLTALGASNSQISGPYVFSLLGTDASFAPEGIAGTFTANGGAIASAGSLIDIHDGVGSTATITTGSGLTANSSYAFDTSNSGTGRGTLTLSIPSGTLTFAFYAIDSTELYLVEIDGTGGYLAGTVYSGVSGASGLAAANYVLVSGGATSTTAGYAAGGVLVSSGSGTISGGTFDTHGAATVTANATVVSCPYTVNSATGRVDLKVYTGTGSCPGTASATLSEYAMYPYQTDQTDQLQSGYLLLEIDPNNVSTGVAYQQTSVAALTGGGLAVGLAGQGITHGARATSAQNVDGQLSTLSNSFGNLDVNFFQPRAGDPVSSVTIATPSNTGRGTIALSASSPAVTYNLVYYIVNNSQALVLDGDANNALVLTGSLQRQF